MPSLIDSLKSEAISKIPGANLVSGLTQGYHQDNVFIKTRDILYNFLKSSPDFKGWEDVAAKYKIAHKDVPDRKFGPDGAYNPEFERLYNFIVEVGGLYSTTLAQEIRNRIPVYNVQVHDTTGTLNLIKNFIANYPRGYQVTSTVPVIKTGESNPLSLINKETTPVSQPVLNTTPGPVPTPESIPLVSGSKDLPITTAGFSLRSDMTTMIMILLAVIVMFFLFK